MMIAPAILMVFAVVFTVLYVVLAILAFNHVIQEKKSKFSGGLLALTFWWPFYNMYDEYGKKLCIYGKVLLPATVITYILIYAA